MLKESQIIVWLVERKVAFQPPVLDVSRFTNIFSASIKPVGRIVTLVKDVSIKVYSLLWKIWAPRSKIVLYRVKHTTRHYIPVLDSLRSALSRQMH